MRKISLLFGLFLVIAALPAAANTYCDMVIDSRAYDDSDVNSWCWLSSKICYYCWGSAPDEHCAGDWEPCDVSRPRPAPQPPVAQARPRAVMQAPCVAKTLDAPPQIKLEHVL